jgi:hypothetical protein
MLQTESRCLWRPLKSFLRTKTGMTGMRQKNQSNILSDARAERQQRSVAYFATI